jgi:hypothetical protein
LKSNTVEKPVPIEPIIRQLDSNFFSGRWDTLTDRQKDLLCCIGRLANAESQFTIAEIVEVARGIDVIRSFTSNDVSQMLPRLIERGLIYKNRLGKYSFAVPLFSRFINRTLKRREKLKQGDLFPEDD